MYVACTHRVGKLAFRAAVAFAILAAISCSDGKYPKRYPVKGKILIDGQTAKDCQIVLHPVSAAAGPTPTMPSGLTNEAGEFQLTSFVANDGAPEGEYVVTIERRERSGIMQTEFDGPDFLGGDYANVERNKALEGFVVKVGKEALVLPPFQLTQSPQAKRKYELAKKRGPALGGPLGGER